MRGIDLRVEAGRCVLVCGASGCGKTTVTRLANGWRPVLPGDARGTRAGGRARRGRPRKLGGGRMRGLGVPEPAHAVLQRGFHGRGGVSLESMAWPEAHTRAHARYHPPAGVGGAGRPQHLSLSGGEKQRIAYASSWAPIRRTSCWTSRRRT
ncbi:MAG: hypothetical protein ACLSVD_00435 [Eggerthellaceae bacterium]